MEITSKTDSVNARPRSPLTTVIPPIEPKKRIILQVVNVVSFVICMCFNVFTQGVMPTTLREINSKYENKISPAGWAFSIWGIIYFLLAVFTVYQALPGSWVTSRSDDFIFNKIGWLFSVNMILNAAWLPIFMTDSSAGFICAEVIIVLMLATNLIMLKRALNNKLTALEMIAFRCGMSIYSGWVLAATFVSGAVMFKQLGWTELNGYDELTPSVVMLWVACVLYSVATFINRDPLFSGVLIWASLAIRTKQTDETILFNLLIIVIFMSIYVTLISIWLIVVHVKARQAFWQLSAGNDDTSAKTFKQKLTTASHGILF